MAKVVALSVGSRAVQPDHNPLTALPIITSAYSNADHTFWESTSQQLSQTFITGMHKWNDWAEMESDWDEHISAGLETIIKGLNQIDGIVPTLASILVSVQLSTTVPVMRD